jgi:hypothetical protein
MAETYFSSDLNKSVNYDRVTTTTQPLNIYKYLNL